MIHLQAGTEETWVYPSQQMFFNALLRKGEMRIDWKPFIGLIDNHSSSLALGWEFEEGSLAPEDMDHIIKIHNANNESAWQEVILIIHTFIELFSMSCVLSK